MGWDGVLDYYVGPRWEPTFTVPEVKEPPVEEEKVEVEGDE